MEKQRIYCENGFGSITEAEQIAMCQLLIKAGYTVKRERERKASGNKYIYYIEYWR